MNDKLKSNLIRYFFGDFNTDKYDDEKLLKEIKESIPGINTLKIFKKLEKALEREVQKYIK